jgi:hypothetical protein
MASKRRARAPHVVEPRADSKALHAALRNPNRPDGACPASGAETLGLVGEAGLPVAMKMAALDITCPPMLVTYGRGSTTPRRRARTRRSSTSSARQRPMRQSPGTVEATGSDGK